MLGRDQLVKYYQKAAAVLAPIQWDEPFGLSMAEANSCGTPVVAFRRGSVPEVVDDGKSGYIVDNSAEMIMAIEKLDKINRKDWNLNWNTVLEAGGVLVGEEVALTADVELAKVK